MYVSIMTSLLYSLVRDENPEEEEEDKENEAFELTEDQQTTPTPKGEPTLPDILPSEYWRETYLSLRDSSHSPGPRK